MEFLSLRQLAVAASWHGGSVLFFRTLFVQVAAPAPHTTGRVLTVRPTGAELLTVVALRKAVLSPVCPYPDCYVAEGCQPEDLLGLRRFRLSNEEEVEIFG
jgi:hypothetical protein